MRSARRVCILALFVGGLLAGCSSQSVSNANKSANATDVDPKAARTSSEELGLLVNMPYEAEDCVWKLDETQKHITAVLHFDQEDTAKLANDVEKIRPPEEASVPSETWFPSDMIVDSDLRGDEQVHGKSFAADPFFQEPYTTGRLVRIHGTDYWVLQLEAK